MRNIKEKSYCFDEFSANVDKEDDFTNLDVPDLEFQFKNILPIPIFLTKVFIQLQSTTPYKVAKAFIGSVSDQDTPPTTNDSSKLSDDANLDVVKEKEIDDALVDYDKDLTLVQEGSSDEILLDNVLHAVQF